MLLAGSPREQNIANTIFSETKEQSSTLLHRNYTSNKKLVVDFFDSKWQFFSTINVFLFVNEQLGLVVRHSTVDQIIRLVKEVIVVCVTSLLVISKFRVQSLGAPAAAVSHTLTTHL